ncbi:unnamed protein product [Cyclocybe aegerita]|uniref:Uncharacterized protein n=1 Tax=Cyclocybe aegerita TaxID=1973307 RepID=A0A8S0WE31_CYCAE|nr:unnamed protein product [Cyclocybe aegerita]
MSHSNRHHPPSRGTRRERPPDPPEAAENAPKPQTSTVELTKTSPHSNRILKKGKITHKPDVTLPASVPTPPAPQHSTQTTTQTPATLQTLLEVLTSQLESLSRTLLSLVAHNPDFANVDTSGAQKALHSLSDALRTKAAPTTTTTNTDIQKTNTTPKTYAAAVATTTPSLRPSHSTRTGQRQPHSRRIIIAPVVTKVKHQPPHDMRNSFNWMLTKDTNEISRFNIKAVAVEYTHLDNIAITITPPSAATILVNDEAAKNDIIKWARRKYALPDDEQIQVTLDDPWHRVVVHSVPAKGPCAGMSDKDLTTNFLSEWLAFNQLAPAIGEIRRIRPLVPDAVTRSGDKLATFDSISWCIAFQQKKQAQWVLRNGLFLYGTYCRTSTYKPLLRSS